MNAPLPIKPSLNPQQGWKADLQLEFVKSGDRTVLGKTRRYGPLTVQRPFYPENEICHLYLLHPPGGIVGGDILHFTAEVKENASALMTTPGAAKFYRSTGIAARQQQSFKISEKASFEWFPQETIIYPGANAEVFTEIHLQQDSVFVGWEIICLGLSCNQERFSSGRLAVSTVVFRNGKPLFIDKLRIEKASDLDLKTGLGGASVTGTMIAAGVTPDVGNKLKEISLDPPALVGFTTIDDLLIVRYLGEDSQEAKSIFTRFWEQLRPVLLGRPACLPRIWAT